MASIQILELRPVEDQVEDLSYDMTGSILGGSNIDCIRNFISAFIEAFQSGDFLAIPEIVTEYVQCIEADTGPIV